MEVELGKFYGISWNFDGYDYLGYNMEFSVNGIEWG